MTLLRRVALTLLVVLASLVFIVLGALLLGGDHGPPTAPQCLYGALLAPCSSSSS